MDDSQKVDGMQEVHCRDCGTSLGWQGDGPIMWEVWIHTRCPVRTARALDMSREDYNKLFSEVSASIYAAYPDFGPSSSDPGLKVRVMRANIAAGMVLENLGEFHYRIIDPD